MSRNFVRRIESFTATVAFVALMAIFLSAGSLGQQRGTRTAKVHGAARGAAHLRVVTTLDELIQGAGSAGNQDCAKKRLEKQRPRKM